VGGSGVLDGCSGAVAGRVAVITGGSDVAVSLVCGSMPQPVKNKYKIAKVNILRFIDTL
jgi:hypothetical protein